MTQRVILSGYRGSIAHNLHIPAAQDETFGIDDTDFFELYCFPNEYYLSLDGYYHSSEVFEEIKGDSDTVGYEIRKAFHLLSECNPNVLLFLYNRPEHYRHISAGGKLLLKNREIFLSRERIKKAFFGYASDQLNKLKVSSDRSFMGPRRRRLFDKFGFDTKKAMTAVRLMIQGKELLETGTFKVFRDTDRDFLLSIKKGHCSIEQIRQIAANLKTEIEAVYKTSPVPDQNNKTKINRLLIDILITENNL